MTPAEERLGFEKLRNGESVIFKALIGRALLLDLSSERWLLLESLSPGIHPRRSQGVLSSVDSLQTTCCS